MKRKHKDAMIAMGIKISALEQIQRNHGQAHMAQDLLPQFVLLVKKVELLESRMNCGNHPDIITRIRDIEMWKKTLQQRLNLGAGAIERIDAIEAKMKEQRGDYHDHIAQLVLENKAAHTEMKKTADVARECSNRQATEILKMQEQIKGLENRLSRAQDMIAEMHKDGFIPVKKAGRSIGKAASKSGKAQ